MAEDKNDRVRMKKYDQNAAQATKPFPTKVHLDHQAEG